MRIEQVFWDKITFLWIWKTT